MMDRQTQSVTHPGEVIRKLLADRQWTQADLATVLGKPLPAVNEIIGGKKAITPETAIALATAFGNTAADWMNLEVNYRLSLVSVDATGIDRRRRLLDIAPIKEMEKRGWIKQGSDAAELEDELKRFFGVESLEQEPQITVATKRPVTNVPLTPAQRAWCFRARQLAKIVHAEKFDPNLLPHCEKRLRELAAFPDEARNVAKVLAGYGIRFVVVEPIATNKMDGAAFWLSPTEPVIAVSVRYDRIDAFWFTVGHEFMHIKNGDALSLDADLVGESALPSEAKPDIERKADQQAAEMLIPSGKLQSFIVRVGPLYSKGRINQFANVMKIHPGIVVGQLHHRGEVPWNANREMLVKVRSLVTSTALTDGWGKIFSPDSI